jgi:putative transposase
VARFIAAQRVEHRIPQATACRALGVSPAWFYKWVQGDASPRRARRAQLGGDQAVVRRAPGQLRVAADLREAGWRVSENTVAQLMREQQLLARRRSAASRRPVPVRAGGGRRI